jgi:hypothetical protein
LNVLLHPFLCRDEERRGEVKSLGASPNTTLGRKHSRGINWRMRLLEGLGKEAIVLQLPELSVVGKWLNRGPRLHNDVSPFVIAFVILILVDAHNLMRVFQKPPADTVL